MSDERRRRRTASLNQRSGRDYWRGLEELLDTDEFHEALEREFPAGAAEFSNGMTRRTFVKLLGASLALAGVNACAGAPAEKIYPYATQPPELTPGIPLHYATSMVLDGYATGLVVESHAGRPTKVEGNPEHPASLGASGVYEQASVLQLYDPHRARSMTSSAVARPSWSAFVQRFTPAALRGRVGERGAGLGFLLEPTSSLLTAELLGNVRDTYPDARVYFHAPLENGARDAGMRLALGRPLLPHVDFTRADVILSLDADFLSSGPFHLRYAHDFASRRHIEQPMDGMNRLYVAEASPTPTGGVADHRLRVRASEIQSLLAAILAEVVVTLGRRPPGMPQAITEALPRHAPTGVHSTWVRAVARDLVEGAGRGIVIAGERQPANVHAMTYLLNAALENIGTTTWYAASPILEAGEPSHDLGRLVAELHAGEVDTLVMLGGNPVYTAPADLELARTLRAIPRSAYLGPYDNETARTAHWFLPALHYLESWGDARAYDGTTSIIQPLIAPMYEGRTVDELLAVFAGRGDTGAHDLLQQSWRRRVGGTRFESFWEDTLHRGLVPDSGTARETIRPRWDALLAAVRSVPASEARAADSAGLEVIFARDPSVYDGRFANNAWLQELPDPMTKLTWDNAALVSPATADRLGAQSGDVLELRYRGRTLRVPALVLPCQADDAITLDLGYGREGAEAVARGVGANAYHLRTAAAPYFDGGLAVQRTSERHELALTQTHWALRGRDIVRQATLDEYRARPDFTAEQRGRVLSLYQPFALGTGDQWAMTIDLSTCTGCSACVVACQAENNIPVVGPEGVRDSREMHWLRIDRYFSGEPDEPDVVMQPMLCQHCEKAPCEYVCPVNATVHSPDGLNEMVYNRCVGTRFCSNNCPYKVRRFNWFDYNAEIAETEAMVKNPDVTVRARGVMEKCTFCVQRIRRGQIDAELEGRTVRPGEVKTACQQACPTQAIVFGSFTDPEDRIVRELAQQRSYAVLHELGTQPRVRYLARITNPNPALGGER